MITPVGHRLIVKPDEIEKMTKGGLHIPETTRDIKNYKQIFGTVISIGSTAWKAFDDGLPWAKVGDKIAMAENAGYTIQDPDTEEKFRIINDEDVCAVITK
jgi:co-chaperonin GroES (HSP10)